MAYDWDDKQNDCYRLYVEENMSLEKVMEWFTREHGSAPSRRAFQVQFKRWGFPSKQNPLEESQELTARVKGLWEANIGQKDMLRQLNDEGFAIKERELMRLRGRNHWLLRNPNGQGLPNVGLIADDASSPQRPKRGRKPGQQAARQIEESDPATLGKHQEILQKRQAESDELWAMRKRRRRTRGWAGLPADPEGPPRFPSETTLDESKVVLQLDNETYRKVRDDFQTICVAEGVIKKTLAGPDKWQQVKELLISESEHLQRVLYQDDTEPLEQKALSLDVVCLDVTKRMRVMQTRVTIADAKNVLCINPEESRQLRAAFFAKLKDENFTNKTELGQERWNQLKGEWIADSALLQRILDPSDREHQAKLKAVEMLCRDVMKRLRDDLARRNPNRPKHGKAPGPGPAQPRQPAVSSTQTASSQAPPVPPRTQAEQIAAAIFASTDLQIDPSLLLAASDALPHMLDADEQNQAYLDALSQPQNEHRSTEYTAQEPTPIGIWMRLHQHSPWQAEPKLWLGTMASGTLIEVQQQVLQAHPGTRILRIAGIVKTSPSDGEVSYTIDDDAKLSGYMAHTSGGDAMFEASLAPLAV